MRAVGSALHNQSDIRLTVKESIGAVELLLAAEDADVVIFEMIHGAIPAVADLIVDEYPTIGIVCIDCTAQCGVLYKWRPPPVDLESILPGHLVAGIRQAAGQLSTTGPPSAPHRWEASNDRK